MNALETPQLKPHSSQIHDTLIYNGERVRVWRRSLETPPHSLVVKEPLGPDAATRLQREVRILEKLRGLEGVPQLADGAAPPGTILLQDSRGTRLLEALARGPMSMRERVHLMLGLTQIAAAVHARGVVHKDINPVHVLLCGADRKPLLVHFELATTSADEHSAFVHHRHIAGALAYLAPELTGRTGRSVDQRADLYALGATFYQLSVGRAPFEESDPLKLVHEVLVRVPAAPIEVRRTVPRTLSEIIMRLLEKEPDRRYQSAEGLAHDLAKLLQAIDSGETASFVLGERDFASRLLAPPRLVGRANEVSTLQAAFRNSLQGSGCTVVICGEPGVGKTALLNELRSAVTAQRGWFVSGKFDARRRDMAADGVHQALEALGRLLLAEPESELLAMRADILRVLGSADTRIVASVLPQFALLLGVDAAPDTQDPLQNSGQLIQITLNLLRAIVSPTRPLALVLEDLQWAGATPLGFFEAAIRNEGLRGLLLVGVCRQGASNPVPLFDAMFQRWRELESGPVFVQLQNLPAAELAELLGEILRLPAAEADKLASVIGERTKGNPYETVELVNALRRDGVLVPQDGGWSWDAAKIRRYIGSTEVLDVLHARIERLPKPSLQLLECMACLGSEVEIGVLRWATGLSDLQIDAHLVPALDDGLVTLEDGGKNTVRFRHDRVQQGVYTIQQQAQRDALRLLMASRLGQRPEHESLAAELYLTALHALPAEEYQSVAALFGRSASDARLMDPATAERFLSASLKLLRSEPGTDEKLLLALEIDRHAALCSTGRLDEADGVYGEIERRCADLLQLSAATCEQVGSLSNRGLQREAVALGFEVLARLGLQPPGADIDSDLDERLRELYEWLARLEHAGEMRRAPATDSHLQAKARLLYRLTSAAFFYDPRVSFWLALEGQRLSTTQGNSSELIGPSTFAPLAVLVVRRDYRAAYTLSQHLERVATTFGNEHQMLYARFNIAFIEHWFEPLSEDIAKCESLRTGFLREGDLRFACYSQHIALPAIFECASTLESSVTEAEAALALARRCGDEHSLGMFIVFRQLLRALRGETDAPGSFVEASFDESRYHAGIGANQMARAYYHINRALCALLFDGTTRDLAGIAHHAASALELTKYIAGHYPVALAHFCQAMVLAAQIRAEPAADSAERLEQLGNCREWLARRADDAPANFLNLLHLVDAEKAWAVGEDDAALMAFDLALRDAEQQERPWHLALITERASQFHKARGLEHTARTLLREARDLYDRWGAAGKVQDLQHAHGFLKAGPAKSRAALRNATADAGSLSSDSLDLVAILRASQALSSETSLQRLKSRVVEVLGALTGATRVLFVSRGEEDTEWFFSSSASEEGEVLPVAEAGARGMLPLSIFRYVERTREPLLLDDATRDDRFSRDSYFADLECCSLLAAPILSQGVPRAVLVLENRSSRSAFSADRLDAVMLMAGQLGVSLDNAGRYQMLERKVSERTAELAHSLSLFRATLESATDAMAAVDNNWRLTTCNENYLRMWGISREQLEGQPPDVTFQIISAHLKDPERVFARIQHLIANPEEESSEISELRDGRVFEEYSRPQRIGNERIGRVFCFREITERRRAEAELQKLNEQLIEASRQGGMAEVATNVLHNVGNVLTSVNVSATVVSDSLRRSRVVGLQKVVTLMEEKAADLPAFMASERGKHLPVYLAQLCAQLQADQETCVRELELLRSHIEHIRDIVTMQQTYAKTSAIKDVVHLSELIEDSLRLNLGALSRHGVQIVREFEPLPQLRIEKHKVLQVLVNLISNAKYASDGVTGKDKQIILRIARDAEAERARISVTDNGVGIPRENLTRIFNHGFTTRASGHGFGLHSSALAAREMGGSLSVRSDGPGTGATFILELPLDPVVPS